MNEQNSRGFKSGLEHYLSVVEGDAKPPDCGDWFELFSTTGGATVGGEEEAHTLDGGSGRPSNVINATLLRTFCPKGALVAQIYETFSLQGNVNIPFIICAPPLFKTIS